MTLPFAARVNSFTSALRTRLWPVAVVLLTACAGTASTFVAAPPQPEKGSVVYIYRPSSSSNFLFSPNVVVDENEQFSIANGDYRYVYLQAGQHSIGLQATDQYTTESAVALVVEAGQSYYLRVRSSLEFEKDSMNKRKFWVEVVDAGAAQSEIRTTEYAGPEPEQSTATQADQSDDAAGFSVDKTQDPFAGKSR